MTDWVRLWHDMPTDPKWRVIARKSGQPLACVIALFTLMLTTASAADQRGSIAGLSNEDAAAALDMDEDAVVAIREAMEGRVLEDGRLSGWDRRQPKRERENDDSSQRVKEHRQRRSTAQEQTERHVTPCNAKKRLDKSREDNTPPTPPGGEDWVPSDEWAAFEKMRTRIRKPMTEEARRLAVRELARLRDEGHDPAEVLNQSVMNSWQGLFPIKARARASPDEVRMPIC